MWSPAYGGGSQRRPERASPGIRSRGQREFDGTEALTARLSTLSARRACVEPRDGTPRRAESAAERLALAAHSPVRRDLLVRSDSRAQVSRRSDRGNQGRRKSPSPAK